MKKEDFQEFFKQRMAEIMHKDTLDSYRVRANNAHTILRELSYVLEGWLAGNVKRFETVGLCIDEAINLIENDSRLIFPSYTKALFVGDLKSYASISKSKKDMLLDEETSKLIYLVNECLASNDGVYLANLIKSIEAQVKMEGEIEAERFSPKLREFDGLLSSFACELLTIGYSKRYLYKFFNSFKKNRRGVTIR